MKQQSRPCLSFSILGICLLILIAPSASNAAAKYITGNGVHIRSLPTSHSPIIGKLYKGAKVVAQGYSGNHRWTQIEAPAEAKAWVSRYYINNGYVTATHLNLRSGPGTWYNVMGAIDNGAKVEIIGSHGNWYQIKAPVGRTTAFVFSAYVKDGQSPAYDPIQEVKPKVPEVPEIPKTIPAPTKSPKGKSSPQPPAAASITIPNSSSKKPDPAPTTTPVSPDNKEPAEQPENGTKKKPGFFKRLFGKEGEIEEGSE